MAGPRDFFRTSQADIVQFEEKFKVLLKQIDMKKTPYTLKEQYEARGREQGMVNTLEVFKQYKAGLSIQEIAKQMSLKYELVKNTIAEAQKLGLI